jgi:hypothetical protein
MTESTASLREQAARNLAEGSALVNDADRLAIMADLAEQSEAAEAARQQARDAVAEAEAALAPETDRLARLDADLGEAERRAAACQAASDDADLTVAIEAETVKLAAGRVADRFRKRAAAQRQAVQPFQHDLAEARRKLAEADADAAEILTAMLDPLFHPRAHRTAGYTARLISGRAIVALIAGNAHPEYEAAHGFIMQLLKMTGIGAEIEANAIAGRDREIQSGPLITNRDGVYTALTGPAANLAVRGARSAHPLWGATSGPGWSGRLADDAGAAVAPGMPGVGSS